MTPLDKLFYILNTTGVALLAIVLIVMNTPPVSEVDLEDHTPPVVTVPDTKVAALIHMASAFLVAGATLIFFALAIQLYKLNLRLKENAR